MRDALPVVGATAGGAGVSAPLGKGGGPRRRGYLDWLRGVAVVIMIGAHLLDSWTGGDDRGTREFRWAMLLGGMGAPLFLFLAGVAVPLSAGSKLRRSGDAAEASRMVQRRGLEIYGLAFLFRLQAWVLGWSSPRALLKVDVLNIMGPSIAAAAALWRLAATVRRRVSMFAAAAAATAFVTPLLRGAPIAALPDPLEAYLRPVPGLTHFAFFPWMGFVFAGAVVGVLIDQAMERARETRLNIRFGIGGLAVAAAALAGSYFPSLSEGSDYWTTSPSFFFLRAGLMTAAVALAYAWESRPRADRWSPLRQLGRTSLFIYWIHVEMLYGLISLPLHAALSLPQAALALVLFTAFMLGCSVAKDRAVAWWHARRRGRAKRPAPAG